MRLCPKPNVLLMVLCLAIGAVARAQEIRNIPQFIATPDGGPTAPPAPGFFRRLVNYYRDDWFPPPQSSAVQASSAPQKRGLPSPLDSPPLPSGDWSYGGSPDIGAPDGNSYPLMTAINGAKSRSKIYGWIEPGVNGSTSSHTNAPEVYDQFPNAIHQYCQNHFIRDLAKPMSEMDSKSKVQMRKKVRGLRKLEKEVLQQEGRILPRQLFSRSASSPK